MSDHHRILSILGDIATPAYVADETRLREGLKKFADIKARTGTQIIYAIKGCPLYHLFPIIAETLDGATASGPYEAKLGYNHFGKKGEKEIHVFCPAYTLTDIDQLLDMGTPVHFYFNSVRQLEMFEPKIKAHNAAHKIGIRINPRLSVTSYEQYNPCRSGSYLGVPMEELDNVPWDRVDILHAHALCENMAEESAKLIDRMAFGAAQYVAKVNHVNFGGGHFITDPDYNADILVDALNRFKTTFPHVQTILEPGGSVVLNAGYIVASVIDVVETDGVKTAILDASANCHCPDVRKAGVRLDVLGAGEAGEKPHSYTLASRTCMASDIWGDYSFDAEIKPGDKIVFDKGLQYSLGEANWFNGHPRPDFTMIRADGKIEILQRYGYEDFEEYCG